MALPEICLNGYLFKVPKYGTQGGIHKQIRTPWARPEFDHPSHVLANPEPAPVVASWADEMDTTLAAEEMEAATTAPVTAVAAEEIDDSGREKMDDDATEKVDDAAADKFDVSVEKKKKSKGKSKGAKKRGTGFEEGFADPPITPAEFEEERLIYDPATPFVDRIEECIQRYRARRRLDSTRNHLFSRYLNLGGVDTAQRQFQGAAGGLDGLTKAERRLAAANDVINRRGDDVRWFTPDTEGWTVDFFGVLAGYFSRLLPEDVAGDPEMIQMGIDTIQNFINYVIKHDVCSEYNDSLHRCRELCKTARAEFPRIHAALAVGMGQFNYACRCVFGLAPDEESSWIDRFIIDPAGTRETRPVLVFSSTLTILEDMLPAHGIDLGKYLGADSDLATLARDTEVVQVRTEDFEIVAIRQPAEKDQRVFRALHNSDRVTGYYRPAGTVVVRPSIVEDGFVNTPKFHLGQVAPGPEETFVFDCVMLDSLGVGMKLRLETAVVEHPDFRFKFVRNLVDVYPSFDLFLPQALMLGFKDPKDNPRDGPTVDNPDMDLDMGGGGGGSFDEND